MDNIEGDYDEITAWLDANNKGGVGYSGLHGVLEDGGFLNVGLFSLNEDHSDEGCHVCQGYGGGRFTCDFSLTEVEVDTDEYSSPVKVENPHKSHLIRF